MVIGGGLPWRRGCPERGAAAAYYPSRNRRRECGVSEAVAAETIAVTVHGSAGAVDLLVPLAASTSDVAREYAAQTGTSQAPQLFTTTGRRLDPERHLSESGVSAGALLVASTVPLPEAQPPAASQVSLPVGERVVDGGGSVWLLAAAAVLVTMSGLLGTQVHQGWQRDSIVALMAVAAAIGVVPFGRHTDLRGVTAPAFGASLGYLLAWEPGTVAQPMTFGIAGLGAALVAGVARASGAGPAVVQTVWMAGGAGVFAATGAVVLTGAPPQLAWALLVIGALMATRSVVAVAVDVPDQMLIDLERLAVTAWSARDRPRGRRGRIMIREAAVTGVMVRGARIVDAAAVGILVVIVFSVPRLLTTATFDVDRPGAQCLVLFTGAGLLLAARSFRHVRARALLRTAGLFAWAALAVQLLDDRSDRALLWFVVALVVLAAGLLVAAIATGRGWRSAWWSARAELAETLAGAFAIASLVVASGLVRMVWENPFTR